MIDLRQILAAYPRHLADARWVALGNAGGFSGSRIWRGTTFDGQEFALKQYSLTTTERQLERVHRWMTAARNQGLPFVPAMESCRDGRTIATQDDRCWDISTWMPGQADFQQDPSDEKLFAAVTAIARIHLTWPESHLASCPAVGRRHRVILEWKELVRSGWRPRITPDDPIAPHAEVAWNLLPEIIPRVLSLLPVWLVRLVPVQPCLGDVWHDHILFEGSRVTGVIDFAAAKMDHIAADLARLLGSLIPDDRERTASALRVYAGIRPLPNPELVGILDRSGVVASVVNWMRRLYHDREEVADRAAVARRMSQLVGRLSRVVDFTSVVE